MHNSNASGGGGGGGGGSLSATVRVRRGDSFATVVGTGGAAGISGLPTTVTGPNGLILVAGGGTTSATNNGGTGGTATITPGTGTVILASVTMSGQNGSDVTPLGLTGFTFPAYGGVGGGSSLVCAGGASPGASGTQTGGLFGGGGSGVSLSGTPDQNTPATAGADGCVIITYTQTLPCV